jgi:hypothetical protein
MVLAYSVFLLSSGICTSARAEDVLYTKDGSVIQGTIIEEVPGVSVKIQADDGSVVTFMAVEIKKIIHNAVMTPVVRIFKYPRMGVYFSGESGGATSSSSGSPLAQSLAQDSKPGNIWSLGVGFIFRADKNASFDFFMSDEVDLGIIDELSVPDGGSYDLIDLFDNLKFGCYIPKTDLFGYLKVGIGSGLLDSLNIDDSLLSGTGLSYGAGIGYGRNPRIFFEVSDKDYFNLTVPNNPQAFSSGDRYDFVEIVGGVDVAIW